MNELDATQQFSGSSEQASSNESRSLDGRIIHAVKSFMELIEQGNAPDRDTFLSRYPEIADQLAPYLDGLLMVENKIAKDLRGLPRHLQQTQAPSGAMGLDPGGSLNNSNLGDFKILGELGRGGMGVVYEAFQISLGRRVALKVLSLAGGLDPIRLQRFKNEAQAAAQLHHTHIVPVYAVGSDRGVHFYAMQLIEGKSLASTIDRLIEQKSNITSESKLNPNQSDSQTSAPGVVPHDGNTKSIKSKSNTTTITHDQFALDSTVTSSSRSERVRFFRSISRMMHQAALGLEHAHQYGVIHRDIKRPT